MSDEEAATVILSYRTRAGWQDVQGLARVSQVFVKRSRAEIKKFQVRRALKQGHQEVKIRHYLHCKLHAIKAAPGFFQAQRVAEHPEVRRVLRCRNVHFDQHSMIVNSLNCLLLPSSGLFCFVTTPVVMHQHMTAFPAHSFH